MSRSDPQKRPNRFAGGALDRAPERRADPVWLRDRLRDPETRLVPVWRSRCLVTRTDPPRPVFLTSDQREVPVDPDVGPIFLGIADATVFFAVSVTTPDGDAPGVKLGDFLGLRGPGAVLDQAEGSLLAYARAIVGWHERHRHCGVCGAVTESEAGGHLRRCSAEACRTEHFPRTDPAIIVLVTDGERCLLGRKEEWPPGVYSTLAGFVEPGESLREAVIREVREETGVVVGGVRHHSSQPWPFPSSPMLGFRASYRSGDVTVDRDELEDARWFERTELRALERQGSIRLPPPVSIARRLIGEWLEV